MALFSFLSLGKDKILWRVCPLRLLPNSKQEYLKNPNAVVALMEATSCVPGVQAHRYSGQQD